MINRTRRAVRLAIAAICGVAAMGGQPDFRVQVEDPEAWRPLLSSVGVEPTSEPARFRIVAGQTAADNGFRPTAEHVRVASLLDTRIDALPIYWQEPLELPRFELPAGTHVFTSERRGGAPLVAGIAPRPHASGNGDASGENVEQGLLWTAVGPGPSGYERFPFLVHALEELGFRLPFRQDRLWAFFDSSYRLRADPDYLARRWRQAGIAALHVAAWHFFDPDPQMDRYLIDLLAACRREGVLVYAWLELPHVSEGFWDAHPDCREQTAARQDAKLDWRKLINLADPDCSSAVETGLRRLLTKFDWDGVNLGELYFESLHGPADPARFTPLNAVVRRDVQAKLGFDPLALFVQDSPLHWSGNSSGWRAFADYRAELALELQAQWLGFLRSTLPQGDLVVTQIDDRFDDRMRDYLGADAAALIPLAERYDFTLLIEDPATLWALGPDRYPQIAERYAPLAPDPKRLAIDINIVERYQQTYPTRKQVGGEVLMLIDRSAEAFERVALYFENSISAPDWDLIGAAGTGARLVEQQGTTVVVESPRPFGLRWSGFAEIDGRPWPIADPNTLWLPAGRHRVSPGSAPPSGRVLGLNADLEEAESQGDRVTFRYRSKSRALALLDRRPQRIELDGQAIEPDLESAKRHWSLRLPRGSAEVSLFF